MTRREADDIPNIPKPQSLASSLVLRKVLAASGWAAPQLLDFLGLRALVNRVAHFTPLPRFNVVHVSCQWKSLLSRSVDPP